MVFKDNNEDAVVFFDFENIVYSLRNMLGENPNFELLMDKCQEYGRIVLARAYADWSRHNTVIAPLQASGFDPVYVPTYFYESKERKARKNAVDIHIAIEAVEVMFTQPHINTFILLTGDKDFIPLANALRRNGKSVIAVGVQGTTSPYMRQATDDFVFYHQLLEEPKGKKRKPLQKDIYNILVDTVKKLQSEDQKTVFPQVKHTMTEILGSFNEKEYTDSKGVNFNRFKDFILEAQRLGHVQLVTTGSVNEVLLPGQTSRTEELEELVLEKFDSPSLPELSDIKDDTPLQSGFSDTEEAFNLLVWAVNHANEAGKSPRTSSIKTIMRSANHDFDEKKLKNENGENFSKFSDFIRAATRRDLVRIEGKGIRMEVHPNVELTPVTQHHPASDGDLAPAELQPIIESNPPSDELQPQTKSGPSSENLQRLSEPESLSSETLPSPENNPLPEESPIAVDDSIPGADHEEASIDSADELITPPQEPYNYVSDYRMRVLVVDALRNCEYPAPAHVIGKHCIDASDQRNVTLPNRRLNQLLTSARDKGLLREAPDDDTEGQEYTFIESTQRIKLFLEDET